MAYRSHGSPFSVEQEAQRAVIQVIHSDIQDLDLFHPGPGAALSSVIFGARTAGLATATF